MSKDERMSTEDGVNKSIGMSRRGAVLGGAALLTSAAALGHSVVTNRDQSGQVSVTDPEVTIRRPENGEEFDEGEDVGYIVDVLTGQSGQLTISAGGYERNEDVGAQTDRKFQGEISGLEPGGHSIEALLEYGDGREVGERVGFEVNPSNDGGSDGSTDGDSDPDYQFGGIESAYLAEDANVRDDFEDYLDDVEGEGLLGTLEVIDTAPGYMIQTNDSQVDLEARLLAGNEDKSNEFGFSDDFSKELYDLSEGDYDFSGESPGDFTDFLEYIQSDDIYE